MLTETDTGGLESEQEYPSFDHLLGCDAWDGSADCVARGESEDDWCDPCMARVRELPKLKASIRSAALLEAAEACERVAVRAGIAYQRQDQSGALDCRRAVLALLKSERDPAKVEK